MDIQEAIDRFEMRNKRIDRQAFHPLGDWIDKETYDELIQFRADNTLAIVALKEKQEREKPTLDASQVRAGCMVHDKVYANEIMCSNPPQQKWICRECGAEGIDTIGEYADDEYERLKKERVE